MDADSSYGGSDTAQETSPTHNQFYHKNEITLPVNLDEPDFNNSKLELKPPSPKLPHYKSTASLNVNEDEDLQNLNKSSSSSTSKLNESDSKSIKSGLDNPAFDEKEIINGHPKSTFDDKKDLNSLGLKSPTKSNDEMAEAVNLELVNLKPENGHGNSHGDIPVKKQTELDIGEGYDEYFVPVNEHRKYMRGRGSVTFADAVVLGSSGVDDRGLSLTVPAQGVLPYPDWIAMDQRARGEKLYVTMDKRSKKGCGKCFCWGICLAILIAAIIIGILAATGVILGKEAQPVTENSVSSRQFKTAGIFGPTIEENDFNDTVSSTTSAPISTVSSILPTTDTSRIEIPRALEGQLIIDNMQFNNDLTMSNSSEFKNLAERLEKQIKNALFDQYTQLYGSADINVNVIEFAPGSIVVKYRITWKFKDGVHGVKDPINPQQLQIKLDKHLTNNDEYINDFHVPKSTVTSKRVLDVCQIDNNGCENDCMFDYNRSDFTCTCPEDQELTEDGKTCRYIMHVHHEIIESVEPFAEPTTESTMHIHHHNIIETSAEPTAEPEPTTQHIMHEHNHNVMVQPSAEPTAEPEPSAEPTTQNMIHEHHHIVMVEPTSEPEPTTIHDFNHIIMVESTVQPEPSAEPTTQNTIYNHHIVMVETSPEPTSEPEPSSEPTTQHIMKENHIMAESSAEPTTQQAMHEHHHIMVEPSAEPTAEPEPSAEPTAEPQPSSESVLVNEREMRTDKSSKLTLEPTSEAEPSAEPTAEPEPSAEPTTQSQSIEHMHHVVVPAEPTAEPTAEPEPSAEPTTQSPSIEHIQHVVSAEPTAEPTAKPEPSAEPTTQSQSIEHIQHVGVPVESTAEPTAEPEPSAEPTTQSQSIEHMHHVVVPVEPMAEPEPTAEPQPAVEITTQPIINSSHHMVVPFIEHNTTEPSAEPTAEPEPNAEPTAEPEPSAESTTQSNTHMLQNIVVTRSENEPTAEPTTLSAEPTAEPTAEPKPSEPTTLIPSFIVPIIQNSTESIAEYTAVPEPSAEPTTEPILSVEPITKSSANFVLPVVQNTTELETTTEPEPTAEPTTVPSVIIQISSTESTTLKEITTMPDITTEMFPNITSENVTFSTEIPLNTSEISTENMLMNSTEISAENSTENATKSEGRSLNMTIISSHVLEDVTTETHIQNLVITEKSSELNSSTESTTISAETETIVPETTTQIATIENISTTHAVKYILNSTNNVNTENNHEESTEINIVLTENNMTTHVPHYVQELMENQTELLTNATTVRPGNSYEVYESPEELLNSTVISNEENEALSVVPLDRKPKISEETTSTTLESTLINSIDPTTQQPSTVHNIQSISTSDMPSTSKTVQTTMNTNFNDITKSDTNDLTLEQNIVVPTTTIMNEISTQQIETTTFINMSHIFKTIHQIMDQTTDKEMLTTTLSPSLENDQKNVTNPIEENPVSENSVHVLQIQNLTTTEQLLNTITSERIPETTSNTEKITVPTIQAEIQQTVTESIKVIPEEYTDYNDLLTSSTERMENTESSVKTSNTTQDHSEYENSDSNFADDENSALAVIPLKSKYNKDKNEKKFNKHVNDITNESFNQRISDNINSTSTEVNNISESIMVKEEFRSFSKCASGQFQCTNGTAVKDGSYCIPRSARCDSIDDCTDKSDEMGCEENCLDNFKCASGQCLKRNLVCDGIIHCNDGSDEQNCESWQCRFDELSCGSGQHCVPLTWRCDGRSHCKDGSDETNCLSINSHCANHEFHCLEQNTCIPDTWRCDGDKDCLNGEDEKLCECALDQFKCNNGGCISNDKRCDGVENCSDRSDEWGCLRIDEKNSTENISKTYLEILGNDNLWHYVCSDNWNNTHSNLACQSLGYASSVYTEHTYSQTIQTNTDYYQIKNNLVYSQNAKLLSMLQKTSTCNQIVSIACHEFTCGNHIPTESHITSRIIGGSAAARSQWPSVSLLYNSKRNTHCTASLVSPTWILASYACINPSTTNTEDWTFFAGGIYFDKRHTNVSDIQIKKIKTIVTHPQAKYSQFVYKNDLSLLELNSPVTLDRNVSAICLPQTEIESSQICVIAGWGVTGKQDSNLQQYLQYLPVPTVNMEECNSTKYYNGKIQKDQICAGYTDSEKSPCYNDEGAPLMCWNDLSGVWEIQGLLSAHGNCGRGRRPALYTSLGPSARSWIAHTVGSRAVTHTAHNAMFNV